jgi:hypothetical protein
MTRLKTLLQLDSFHARTPTTVTPVTLRLRTCSRATGLLRRIALARCEPDSNSHQDRHGQDRQPHVEPVVDGALTWVAWTGRAGRGALDHRDLDHDSDDKRGCDNRPC